MSVSSLRRNSSFCEQRPQISAKSRDLSFRLPLDRLPNAVLYQTMGYLETPDLVNLTTFEGPIANAALASLYHTITLTTPHKKLQRATPHSTLISNYSAFLQLVHSTMLHEQLGQLIEKLELEEMEKTLTASIFHKQEEEQGSFWGMKLSKVLSEVEMDYLSNFFPVNIDSLTLLDALNVLLKQATNLHTLVAPSLSLTQLASLSFSGLKELTFTLRDGDLEHLQFIQNCTSLTKLCVQFEVGSEQLLSQFSTECSTTLEQLETLELRYIKTDFNERIQPTWWSFFNNLPADFCFKKLRNFSLVDCQFDQQHSTIVPRLLELVPFAQIESLSLKVYEYSHKGKRHLPNQDPCTLLCMLAPHLHRLRNLSLKPTGDCLQCQINSTVRVLQQYGSNLESLSLSMNCLNANNYNKVLEMLSGCKKLRKLAFFDELVHMKLENSLKQWFVYDNLVRVDVCRSQAAELAHQSDRLEFGCCATSEFKHFLDTNSTLLVLFWRSFFVEYRLDWLLRMLSYGEEYKLYGYDFRVIKHRGLVQVFVAHGWQDLLYY